MFIFITAFEDMVVKFISGFSLAIRSYIVIHCLNFTVLPLHMILQLQELHNKK